MWVIHSVKIFQLVRLLLFCLSQCLSSVSLLSYKTVLVVYCHSFCLHVGYILSQKSHFSSFTEADLAFFEIKFSKHKEVWQWKCLIQFKACVFICWFLVPLLAPHMWLNIFGLWAPYCFYYKLMCIFIVLIVVKTVDLLKDNVVNNNFNSHGINILKSHNVGFYCFLFTYRYHLSQILFSAWTVVCN